MAPHIKPHFSLKVRGYSWPGIQNPKLANCLNNLQLYLCIQRSIAFLISLWLSLGAVTAAYPCPSQSVQTSVAQISVTRDRLEIHLFEGVELAERDEAKIEELRAATPQDSNRIAAERAYAEGKQLDAQGTPESRRKAVEKYEEALQFWRSVGDRRQEAIILNSIGRTYHSLGEKQKSLDAFNQALPLWIALGDRSKEGDTLTNIGVVYEGASEHQKALEYYQRTLEIRQSLSDQREEATTLGHIGAAYNSLRQGQKALDHFDQALRLWRDLADRQKEAAVLSNIGLIHAMSGDHRKALGYLEEVLPLLRAGDDRQLEAATLTSAGSACAALLETQKALEYLNQAVLLWRGVLKDPYGEAFALSVIGGVYNYLGLRTEAREYFDRAQQLRKAGAAPPWELTAKEKDRIVAEGSLAEGMRLMARRTPESWRAAIGKFKEAAKLFRVAGEQWGEAIALYMTGVLYVEILEYREALDYLNQAIRLWRAMKLTWAEASTLNNLGRAYYSLGRNQEALVAYGQALELSRAVGERSNKAFALYGLARVNRKRRNFAEARAQTEETLEIFESLRADITSPEWRASFYISKQEFYEFYIDLLMQMHKQRPAEGHAAAALQANERAHARSLLEMLTEARVDIRQGVDSNLLDRERRLQQQLNAKARHRVRLLTGKHSAEQESAIRKEIEEILAKYREVEAEIRAKSPRYAALTQPQPLSVKEIQQEVLDEETLLLEYALGDERSYLWAVSPDSIAAFDLPRRSVIENAAKRLSRLVSEPPDKTKARRKTDARQTEPTYQAAAAALSRTLLGPVATQLGTKRLLIVSDGALQYLPFAALPVPVTGSRNGRTAGRRDGTGNLQSTTRNLRSFRPLISDHEIISLPSASTLAVLRREIAGRPTAPKTVAVLADPVFEPTDLRVKRDSRAAEKTTDEWASADPAQQAIRRSLERSGVTQAGQPISRLTYSRQEAMGIVALVPAEEHKLALDFEANHKAATDPELGQYRFVHISTHGGIDSAQPALSGILLSLVDEAGRPRNDGLLHLGEIYNLKLPVELVVLSACQTALGEEVKGEGLIGITRGFMYAGAARVSASLWRVDDEATADLMERFYQGMLGADRLRPAAALRAAQIAVSKQKQWQAPYYWAAFVLQGEWR